LFVEAYVVIVSIINVLYFSSRANMVSDQPALGSDDTSKRSTDGTILRSLSLNHCIQI